jgi:hypothetical protein
MLFFAHLALGAACGVGVSEADKLLVPASEPLQLGYRLVLLGAILPDLLDKPLGELIFPNTFHSGKIFGHTLLLSACLLGVGAALYHARRRTGVLSLGIGTASHLLGDAMWGTAATLLWPLLGWFRPEEVTGTWIQRMLLYLSSEWIFFTEMAGFLLLLFLAYRIHLTNFKALGRFAHTGALPVAHLE